MADSVNMKCYCGILEKDNKEFLVNPFLKLENEPIIINKKEYVEVSPAAYLMIYNKLDLLKQEPECILYFDKGLQFDVLQSSDIKLEQTYVPPSEQEKLSKYKTYIVRVMSDSIADKISISNFALYNFFKLNHYLESKGYFITDENREEKYLEVINSGDTEVLEKLSEYLDSLDEFNAIDEIYKTFKEYKNRIEASVNPDELKAIYDEFAKSL